MESATFQPQQFGKYLLVERIGAGGMAEIFRAIAFGVEGFTKHVCIKRILPNLSSDENFIRMFIDEAKISVSLHHANIVQVFDLGRIGEHYFIAMELVKGRDLLAIINRCRRLRRKLPVPVVLHVMAEVCTGLDYAHRSKVEGRPAGIIHRDVSPSNILVSWEGDVKVTDFGIAKATMKEHKTTTGTLKGKYGYMSPEQVMGMEIDHRSDIFAAGVLMWESIMMRRLFKAETDLKTLELVKEARLPELPSSADRRIPNVVDEIILKACAKRPEDRFQTAGEMAEALRDTLYGLGERVDSTRLAGFMKEIFKEEIEKEEQRDRDLSKPELLALARPEEQFATPPTRPDLPSYIRAPERAGMSPLSIAVLGTGLILLAGAIVVLVFWLA
ncbi:MAG: serine/threonine protein kinase, partial [Deltaproteobacteria bacterium]